MKNFLKFSFLICFVCSCGYHLQGSSSVLPPDVKRIAIKPVENLTTEASLSARLTEALRSRFDRYAVVSVVEPNQSRDAELITKIISLDTESRSTSGNTDITQELDLIINISAELRRTNGQVLYKNPSIIRREPIATSGDLVVTTSSSFAQGSIAAQNLSGLSAREIARGQQEQILDTMLDEVARSIYLNAVSAEF